LRPVKSLNDVLSGTFLVLAAFLALWVSWPLNVSSDVGMGPGFVPKMFACILLTLGAFIVLKGFITTGEEIEPWFPRSTILILGAVAFFGLTVERLGLVVALSGLVLIGCAAHANNRMHEAVILAIATAAFSVLVFVQALGLPMLVWPVALRG
jgi:putative tricarboxylic transport membrane protein